MSILCGKTSLGNVAINELLVWIALSTLGQIRKECPPTRIRKQCPLLDMIHSLQQFRKVHLINHCQSFSWKGQFDCYLLFHRHSCTAVIHWNWHYIKVKIYLTSLKIRTSSGLQKKSVLQW
jgi:hypothetical protein